MDARPTGAFQGAPCPRDVRLSGPRQSGDDGAVNLTRNNAHSFIVVILSDRKAGLNHIHTEAIQLQGHAQFVSNAHAASGRLFAIAQCGVKESNVRLSHGSYLLVQQEPPCSPHAR